MSKILVVNRVCISEISSDVQEYPIEVASKQGFLSSMVDEDHFIHVQLK